jgi:soluble lytic murein transglycosylase-like protein
VLVQALGWRESRWDNSLRSAAGAIGIGQLLPETVAFVSDELIGEELDPARPGDNIRIMTRYLRSLIDRFGGDTTLGLSAYLQGATSVVQNGVSRQTADYVGDVLALRDSFAEARRHPAGAGVIQP